MQIIKTHNLSKFYNKGKFKALDNLNIEIEKNTIFGFLGPNGAGKTTTLKLLTGLIKPSNGEIWINNSLINKDNFINNNIGYLSQNPKYYDWMSAYELLTFVGKLFNFSKKDASIRADELIELCGINDYKNRKIRTYSGGMVQRVGIAQALFNKPDVLFLDEPVSDMDPLGRKEILDFIKILKKDTTVFMSSHILEDVERVCDSIAIINKGHLIKVSDTQELKNEFTKKAGTIEIKLSSNKDLNKCKAWINDYISNKYSINDLKIVIGEKYFKYYKNDFFKMVGNSSINIESYKIIKPSLEDIFVSIIGEDNYEKSVN